MSPKKKKKKSKKPSATIKQLNYIKQGQMNDNLGMNEE